ncbi:MAG: hypothetical protein QME06_08975, partial [Desulfobacterales bacterium]|nr:hypothetical protein [Desulfobacterales bacterium]
LTEHDKFLFTWEINTGLGAQRSGSCFILGDILVIGSWNHEEAGYLKLEFHEQLMKLPVWNRTRYYCLISVLRDVNTGQRLSNCFKYRQINEDKINIGHVNIHEPGTFRLGRYKIIVEKNSSVSWQIYEGLNKIVGRQCFTESGILFIGSKEYDLFESQNKKEWFSRLKLLPQWDKTFAWSHRGVLRSCRQGQEPKKLRSAILKSDDVNTCITDNIPLLESQEHKKEGGTKILSSGFGRLKMSWYHFAKWKEWWVRLTPLLIAGLLFGWRTFSLFIGKTMRWSRKIKEYFHKYIKK